MEPPYRGPGGYGSEEQDFPPFHHRPPPPPRPEDEEGEGRFGGRRGDYEEGGYPHGGERRYGRREDEGEDRFGRGDSEEGIGRRRGEERFGRGDDDGEGFGGRRGEGRFGRGDGEGYPPEPPPHFPQHGFHGQPERRHEGYEHDAYNAADDEFPLQKSPPPQFTDSESHYSKQPSTHGYHGQPERHHEGYEHDAYNAADDEFPLQKSPPPQSTDSESHYSKQPSTEYTHAEAQPTNEEPVADGSLSTQLETLSLDLPQGRLVRIFCKGNAGYNLAVEHNSLQMQESNSENESQQWIKDASHGVRIKDSYGYPAFSLVNKKTKKLLKHAGEKGLQVLLTDYQADLKDDSVLWTESQDFGEGFKTVRCASNASLNLTVFEGNKRIRNGSALVLDTWTKGDHQYWKIFPL